MKATQTPVAPRENPLVPFALMKRMYAGMVESRLLEAWLAKQRGAGARSPLEGEEACRAAVLLSVEADDLIADGTGAATSAWLRGAELAEVAAGGRGGLLCVTESFSERVALAVGAAAALKRCGLPRVVVVLVEASVKRSGLRRMWRLAALEQLPILFVVLPGGKEDEGAKSLSAGATKDGVPGIPVEASDAVAICRVAQESLLRARAGGGPALLECIRLDGGKRAPSAAAALAETLLRVGACDQAWLDAVGPAFQGRLKTLKHERPAASRRTLV